MTVHSKDAQVDYNMYSICSYRKMLYFMMRRVDNLDGFTLNVLFLHYYYCFVSVVNVHTVVHGNGIVSVFLVVELE